MSLTLPDSEEVWEAWAWVGAPSGDDSPAPARQDMIEDRPTPPRGERELIDARCLTRIAQRDREALGELYDHFNGPLYATALRILHDRAVAQDVVHDAFVTLWDNAAAFDPGRGSAFSWAVTLVRKRAIDRVRSRRRAAALSEAVPDEVRSVAAGATTAEADAAAFDDNDRVVRTAVSRLPSEQHAALELAFFSGFTQEQIAEKLGEPLGTVRSRIRRGLVKLRDALAHRL